MGRILSPSNGASKLSATSIPHRQLSMSIQNYSRNPKYIDRQLYIDIAIKENTIRNSPLTQALNCSCIADLIRAKYWCIYNYIKSKMPQYLAQIYSDIQLLFRA